MLVHAPFHHGLLAHGLIGKTDEISHARPNTTTDHLSLPQVIDRKEGTSALTNGHQSMVVCGAYLTEEGWRVTFDCKTFEHDNWGLLIPDMKAIVKQWGSLLAAQNCGEIDEHERITVTRNGEDRSLLESASIRAKQVR